MASEGRVQRPRSTSRCGPRSRSGDAQKIERSGSGITLNEINKVVALLNALPAQQPGMRLCPIDSGIDLRLALYARRVQRRWR